MNQSKNEKQNARRNFNTSNGYFGGEKLDHEAPIPVCDCISYLRQRSFFEIGVFRIPGNNDIVEKLKNNYRRHYPTKQEKEHNDYSVLNSSSPTPGVNDVASLLKAFFKELPEPLIPAAATRTFVQIANEGHPKEEEVRRFSKVVKAIRSPERECLGLVISFLRELCSFRRFNNMNADNLSTCFVLSIMGGGDAFDQLFLLREGAQIIKKLIGTPVRMYMPSINNVKNNTKYRHTADAEGGEIPAPTPVKKEAAYAPPPPVVPRGPHPNRYAGTEDSVSYAGSYGAGSYYPPSTGSNSRYARQAAPEYDSGSPEQYAGSSNRGAPSLPMPRQHAPTTSRYNSPVGNAPQLWESGEAEALPTSLPARSKKRRGRY